MERELSKLLGGRKVDLRTPSELSRYFRDEVLSTASVQYAKDDRVRLQHMLDAVNEALTFTEGKVRADLDHDRMLVLSLIRELEIIGEAASKVFRGTRSQNNVVPWRDITGMRNRLIHAYFDVDLDTVWRTVTKDLPALKAEVEKML